MLLVLLSATYLSENNDMGIAMVACNLLCSQQTCLNKVNLIVIYVFNCSEGADRKENLKMRRKLHQLVPLLRQEPNLNHLVTMMMTAMLI